MKTESEIEDALARWREVYEEDASPHTAAAGEALEWVLGQGQELVEAF